MFKKQTFFVQHKRIKNIYLVKIFLAKNGDQSNAF